MQTTEAKVALVIRRVVEQALRDAGADQIVVDGSLWEMELVEQWCNVKAAEDITATTLVVNPANKTQLLLGRFQQADVFPFGDLYASELDELAAVCELTGEVEDLAEKAGGVQALDMVLRRLLDERRDPDDAFADAPHLRDPVMDRLQRTRFHRMQIGIVPKIGPRTLGIDLFI